MDVLAFTRPGFCDAFSSSGDGLELERSAWISGEATAGAGSGLISCREREAHEKLQKFRRNLPTPKEGGSGKERSNAWVRGGRTAHLMHWCKLIDTQQSA